MMNSELLDPSIVSKPILQQIEQVTCIECCKYYIAPETAPCGHSLCHSCWSGRRNCPTCEASVNRKSLKLNLHLQALTDHIHVLGEAFEKFFNVKLEEFSLDIPVIQLQSDPTKNVKEWLACSENHFSAPVSSQQSQDIVESIELSNSKIQIHTVQKNKETTKNETGNGSKKAVTQKCQEDWDKIEILPDTEDISKDKENIVGPMDIEPFYFEDNEYTTDHPRRSSRKRELKNDNAQRSREASVEKQSSKNSGNESKKVKQNWSNVKKMKKEFRKLNTKKSKLNVSIEMFKKAQSSALKPTEASCEPSPKPCYDIDDNSPNVEGDNNVDSLFATKTSIKENKKNDFALPKTNIKEVNGKCANIDENSKRNTTMGIDKYQLDQEQDKRGNLPKDNNSVQGESTTHNISYDKNTNVPVIRKSVLLHKSVQDNSTKITLNDLNSNSVAADSSNDIEISIKIGSTVTNIVIKKNQNDVQFQINRDREIQTSLGPYGITSKRDVSCSPMQVDDVQNKDDENKIEKIQIQPSISKEKTNDKYVDMKNINPIYIEKNNEQVTNVIQSSKPSQKADDKINKTQVIKSISTKKNTESADTATANFDITESVEKELSDIMDCVETKTKDKGKVSLESAKEKSNKESTQSKKETDNIRDEMELINDLDIFNSGSVKEANVKSLQSTNKAFSEILVPTNKSKKSQKVPDKRDREGNEEGMPQNKKQKVDKLNSIEVDVSEETSNNVGNDSEHINYDTVMSQVFANIDADIKSKTQSHKAKSNKIIDKDEEIQSNEKAKATDNLEDTEKDIQQKYSENIFSVLDKDSEVIDVTNNSVKQVEPDSTQKRIENLLTPGMCRDLVSSTREEQEVEPMHVQMGTPLVDSDDSDKSVVEETPQKNVSFTKLKKKSNSSDKTIQANKQKSIYENKSSKDNCNDSQIRRSIINISDTEDSSKLKDKDVTIINIQKKNTLETPLTINKFVDHIKHNSTPVARKSLNFEPENIEDFEQTLCPTTTQEKEFMAKAFEQTPKSPAKRPLGLKNTKIKEIKKFCLAGSCLTAGETANLKLLCYNNGWTYVDKYTKDITHLVVGVDEENRSQRSVKYMCALAASKWIVSYGWVEKCLISKEIVDEIPFEALDGCGEPGPRLSRLAPRMLFEGISFYCMSPFSILDVETLKYILEAAGGRVVSNIQGVKVTPGCGPALLLAEPEHTQEDRFIYLAMELSVVPVNFEWVLNCLGNYSLGGLSDSLLCPLALLPPATRDWPAAMMQHDSQED